MKAFIAMIIVAFVAALGVYIGSYEHEMERAYFVFIGISYGFIFRHKFFEE